MKIEGLNKKLIGIACDFYGMEILLDSGYFHDKNDKLFILLNTAIRVDLSLVEY